MTQFGKAAGPARFGKKTSGRPSPVRRSSTGFAATPMPGAQSDKLSREAQSFLKSYRSEASSSEAVPEQSASYASSGVSSQGKSAEKPVAWIRLISYTIDMLVMAVPFWIIAWPMFSAEMDASRAHGMEAGGDVILKWLVLFLLLKSVYSIAMEASSLQATLGKHVLGLIVTDKNMAKPGLMRVIMRNTIARLILNMVPFSLGYSMIVMNRKKQGIHDWMSGTLVCRRGANPAQNYSEVFA